MAAVDYIDRLFEELDEIDEMEILQEPPLFDGQARFLAAA